MCWRVEVDQSMTWVTTFILGMAFNESPKGGIH